MFLNWRSNQPCRVCEEAIWLCCCIAVWTWTSECCWVGDVWIWGCWNTYVAFWIWDACLMTQFTCCCCCCCCYVGRKKRNKSLKEKKFMQTFYRDAIQYIRILLQILYLPKLVGFADSCEWQFVDRVDEFVVDLVRFDIELLVIVVLQLCSAYRFVLLLVLWIKNWKKKT